jgi:hypothetical protein
VVELAIHPCPTATNPYIQEVNLQLPQKKEMATEGSDLNDDGSEFTSRDREIRPKGKR